MLSMWCLALLALTQNVQALSFVEQKGAKFFVDGQQFYVKGVAYQLTPDDPLAQPDQCKMDAALMQELGANSIRVYHVDPSLDHDECMSIFADAGIYAWIDLDTFDTYILTDGPSWEIGQAQKFQQVMDAFHSYDNVAGFFVANELLTTGESSSAAPYIKAAASDMKAYRDRRGYRNIPIGYSAADIAELRPNLQNYMACGDDPAEALDFYSLNAYEWCGELTFETSGYANLQANASDFNIPIFFSETGCNTIKPRTFGDQSAIFGEDMADTWSGSIIYEWIQELNDYGLITYGEPSDPSDSSDSDLIVEGFTRRGTPTPVNPDFENLRSQWATLTPTGVSQAAYNPSAATPPPCPEFTEGLWDVSSGAALPTLGAVSGGMRSSNARSKTATVRTSVSSGGATTASSDTASPTTDRMDPSETAGSDGDVDPAVAQREGDPTPSSAAAGSRHGDLRRRTMGEDQAMWTAGHKWALFGIMAAFSLAMFPLIILI